MECKVKAWIGAMGLAMGLAVAAGSAWAEDKQVRAEGRVTLGWGRIFTNDALGDGHDRWRTGSYTISVIRGTAVRDHLPPQLGETLEWRLRSEIVSPANLGHPDPSDRRFSGILGFGLHTQAEIRGLEVDLGGDLVALGPMTGAARIQGWIHQALGMSRPDTTNQLPNQVVPTASVELAERFDSGTLHIRPFVLAMAGVETLARAGVDLTWGSFGEGAVMVRDPVTGQRYRAAAARLTPGFSVVAGADVARVFGSELVDQPLPMQSRVRLGVQWQGEHASAFYGLARLSEEFRGQPGGQLLGVLSLNIWF